MKINSLLKKMFVVSLALVLFGSCEKDSGFTQVTTFEKSIHDAINDHRESLNKDKMNMFYLGANNAKQYSSKMATGAQLPGVEGIMDELETLRNNVGGSAASVWVATCQYESADSVMSIILDDEEIKTSIEGDYNQSAVGAVKNAEGTYFITHILLKIPKIIK